VVAVALQVLGPHLAVGPKGREIDHGRVAHPLVDRHRGDVASVDQEMQRRVDVGVGVTADGEQRALQGMAQGVRGDELGRHLPAEVRPDGEAQIDDPHQRYRSATRTATGYP
jgi:hypothetical protein